MTAFDPDKITFFAKTDARGQGVSFGIKAKDRQRHMYVVGKTGMGKSTLLENMAAQDIQNGEGLAFIDPHGSAAETLLEYIPEHRVKDVVYFAPFDLDNPVSFNVMEDVGPDKRHLVVSGLMSTFKKIWVDAWSARMEYILTNALLVLIEYPDTTLLSVNRLFSDKAYRKKVVEYCKDPAVKSFWVDEFAGYTDRFAAEALPAIQNKIGQFTGNPLIRNIIGQPNSSFDIRKLMDEKKILIMNLSKGLIGETNANLLGSMLTTRIYLAAMSRAELPVEQMKTMPNFYFYVDEFQSFANATFADILSEARKYHLNLIIAHQYIEQMDEDVRNAVFGNVGTTVSFRVGPFDAEVLETVYAPRFEAVDLVNLGFAQIYLTLMIDGIGSQPFSAQTLPPITQPQISCRSMVLDSSRKIYASKREDVEKIVAELHTPQTQPQNNSPKKPYEKNGNAGRSQNNFTKNNGNGDKRPYANKPVNKQSDYSPQKPTIEKTPDDLRNILSKMKEANSGGKVEDENKLRQHKEKQKTDFKPKLKPQEKNFNSKPKPKFEENKITNTPDKPQDLKKALADALKKVGSPVQEKSTQTQKPTVKKPVHNDSVRKSQTNQSQMVQSKSQVRKVVIEHRRKYPVVSSSSQSPVVQTKTDTDSPNPINAAEVKRMLRHNDNERSPFN